MGTQPRMNSRGAPCRQDLPGPAQRPPHVQCNFLNETVFHFIHLIRWKLKHPDLGRSGAMEVSMFTGSGKRLLGIVLPILLFGFAEIGMGATLNGMDPTGSKKHSLSLTDQIRHELSDASLF